MFSSPPVFQVNGSRRMSDSNNVAYSNGSKVSIPRCFLLHVCSFRKFSKGILRSGSRMCTKRWVLLGDANRKSFGNRNMLLDESDVFFMCIFSFHLSFLKMRSSESLRWYENSCLSLCNVTQIPIPRSLSTFKKSVRSLNQKRECVKSKKD